MRADITRSTYREAKRYSGVRMQQGRVQVDADWNEQLDIQAHRDRSVAADVVGASGAPEVGGGFAVLPTPDGGDLAISPGRLYIDGVLCESGGEEVATTALDAGSCALPTSVIDGRDVAIGQWLEVSARFADGRPPATVAVRVAGVADAGGGNPGRVVTFDGPAPALTGAAGGGVRRLATYVTQPDLVAPPFVTPAQAGQRPRIALEDGLYLAFLDVWERELTALDDPDIRETALGGVDTGTRTKTVWQLLLAPATGTTGCDAACEDWDARVGRVPGSLAARAQQPAADAGAAPCVAVPGAGFIGLENQLYRVEIYEGGPTGTATFTWSREAGSVEEPWTSQDGPTMTVASTGCDPVLGFTDQGAIELLDDSVELSDHPRRGQLVTGYHVSGATTITLPASVARPADALHPRVRRWESDGEVATSASWTRLELGVEVAFAPGGEHQPGDYWLIPARTATGQVEWPVDAGGTPAPAPPAGVRHRYCRLATISATDGELRLVEDCRPTFASLTELDEIVDGLSRNLSLPDHNRHLHGSGIVCGLAVTCGGDDRSVQVAAGYALAPDGSVVAPGAARFDVLTAATTHDAGVTGDGRKIVDGQPGPGDGEASLYLDGSRDWRLAVEPFEPDADNPLSRLQGTLLMDFYNECVRELWEWLNGQLADTQLRSALTNLGAQVVSPDAGQHIFISPREDALLHAFYDGLRAHLSSDTFCALFRDAPPFPDYRKFSHLEVGMDTVFGSGHHTRLRLRSGTTEGWTVGPGLNPLEPATTLNRYDLAKGQLIESVNPLTATEQGSTGAGSITDVAFVGNQVWVASPTRDGQNTILHSGTIVGGSINWAAGVMTTLCDVKLVTLGTTAADPNALYAIAVGAGLYRIDLSDLTKIGGVPVAQFAALGHLRMFDDGTAYATAGPTAKEPSFAVHRLQRAGTVWSEPKPSPFLLPRL
ncbi:MAG TPA: DUF6519 domain-containing protein, partial [Candidatus Dormibacteraeota bacterium]|nr:DUF6519 domain-containing protein [Candidatus Dormibacteraeota bacterium]